MSTLETASIAKDSVQVVNMGSADLTISPQAGSVDLLKAGKTVSFPANPLDYNLTFDDATIATVKYRGGASAEIIGVSSDPSVGPLKLLVTLNQ